MNEQYDMIFGAAFCTVVSFIRMAVGIITEHRPGNEDLFLKIPIWIKLLAMAILSVNN